MNNNALEFKPALNCDPDGDKPANAGHNLSAHLAPAAGEDVIADIVHEIENLTKEKALESVSAMVGQTERGLFRLGGCLAMIRDKKWFAPYTSFADYVGKEHGLNYGKAMYLIKIYDAVARSKIPYSKFAGLKWTSLREIARIITLENVDYWVDVAKQQTHPQLVETVKAALAGEKNSAKPADFMKFNLDEAEAKTVKAALAKVKADTGTKYNTPALELICAEFLSGMTMVERLKAIGIDKMIEAVEEAFPDMTLTVDVGATSAASS
jgi:hypothetical protein